MTELALEIEDLRVEYGTRSRGLFTRQPASRHAAVDEVSLAVRPGETLALVGESGSGKTTIGNAVLGLAPVSRGRIKLHGRDITRLGASARRALASDLQVIFQNPYGSLNPSLRIGSILAEPLQVNGHLGKTESRAAIRDLLQRVGMPADAIDRYPGHFSGGQRQRIAIARAVAVRPSVIVCDEPTSALDVSTQEKVLQLLRELQAEIGVAYLFITHDLAVARTFAERITVLHQGRLVEQGAAADVCERPSDPYTARLVAAAPVPNPRVQRERRAHRAVTTR